MFLRTKNKAESTLVADINNSVLSLDVVAGEGSKFPTKNFHITIDDEIILCSSRSIDTLTIERGAEGTTPAAHTTGATVQLRITSEIISQIQRGGQSINIEILSADKILTPGSDEMYQYLDPNGANRIITLDTASAKAGDRFIIRNNGVYSNPYYLNIKQGATILDYGYSLSIKEFIFNGTDWINAENGTGENSSGKYQVVLGPYAKGYNRGTAFGYFAQGYNRGVGVGSTAMGYNYSVAVGYGSIAYSYAVAVGYAAYGYNSGVALGHQANCNGKKFSVALGHSAQCYRYSEIAHNINGDDLTGENNFTIVGLEIQTSDNTPTELLCGGQWAQRFTIRPESVLVFTILITARDNITGDCAAYKVEGAIKRDGANNTFMLTAATITVIHEDDVSWGVAVTADDVNESLKIEVTGDVSNIVQWVARVDGVETFF